MLYLFINGKILSITAKKKKKKKMIVIQWNLHVRPPLLNDSLPSVAAYPKHQSFPSQSLTVGSPSERPPPVSDRDHFLGL